MRELFHKWDHQIERGEKVCEKVTAFSLSPSEFATHCQLYFPQFTAFHKDEGKQTSSDFDLSGKLVRRTGRDSATSRHFMVDTLEEVEEVQSTYSTDGKFSYTWIPRPPSPLTKETKPSEPTFGLVYRHENNPKGSKEYQLSTTLEIIGSTIDEKRSLLPVLLSLLEDLEPWAVLCSPFGARFLRQFNVLDQFRFRSVVPEAVSVKAFEHVARCDCWTKVLLHERVDGQFYRAWRYLVEPKYRVDESLYACQGTHWDRSVTDRNDTWLDKANWQPLCILDAHDPFARTRVIPDKHPFVDLKKVNGEKKKDEINKSDRLKACQFPQNLMDKKELVNLGWDLCWKDFTKSYNEELMERLRKSVEEDFKKHQQVQVTVKFSTQNFKIRFEIL